MKHFALTYLKAIEIDKVVVNVRNYSNFNHSNLGTR